MYAIEVKFRDSRGGPTGRGANAAPEFFLVQRSVCRIGYKEPVQILIEELSASGIEIEISRGVGRTFKVTPVGQYGADLAGEYKGLFEFETDSVRCRIYALDLDLIPDEEETPDAAGFRLVREAISKDIPEFPAALVKGATPFVVSFREGEPLYIGRTRGNQIRIDSGEISSKHARIIVEDNESILVEDLGSTNGTFVAGRQIAGRTMVSPGLPIIVGNRVELHIVYSREELRVALEQSYSFANNDANESNARVYPCVVGLTDHVRPGRSVLKVGMPLNVGRDPGSHIWIGAPHVSRTHLTIELVSPQKIAVKELSTNGSVIGGLKIKQGDVRYLEGRGNIVELGEGVKLSIEFNEKDSEAAMEVLSVQKTRNYPEERTSERRSKMPTGILSSSNIPQGKGGSGSISSIVIGSVRTVLTFYRTLSRTGRLVMLVSVFILVVLLVLVGAGVSSIMQKV